MTHDEIEFLISQHFDGTLDIDEGMKLRAALDSDPAVKAMFNEHAKLNQALKASKANLDIDQEWLNAQIAGTIDEAQSRPLPIRKWLVFAPMAAAAMLLIGLTLGVLFLKDETETPAVPTYASSVEIGLPEPTPTPSLAMANVSVGIPANMTPAMMTTLFLVDHRPSGRVDIKPAGSVANTPFD